MRKIILSLFVLLTLALIPLGTTQAQDPTITITSPVSGAVITDPAAIPVSGGGTNLVNSEIAVIAADDGGTVLAQTTTTASPDSNWSAVLSVSAPAGTTGSISALVRDAGGTILAEASIPVTFGEGDDPEPNVAVTITTPTEGAIIEDPTSFTIAGTSLNVFEGNVVVQVLDEDGAVLFEQPTTSSAAQGEGTWSVTASLEAVAGTPATIYAFSPSPATGDVAADDSVNVTLGEEEIGVPAYAVSITAPAEGATLQTAGGFSVSGTALNPPEGTVIVQARDANNAVLAERTTTAVPAENQGEWETTLNVRFAQNTNGNIRAVLLFPEDNSLLAEDVVNVVFTANCTVRTDWPVYQVVAGDNLSRIANRTGSTVAQLAEANCLNNVSIINVGQELRVPQLPADTPTDPDLPELDAQLAITAPSAGSPVSPLTAFSISGTGQGLAENTLFVRALDNTGSPLAEVPVTLNAPAPGEAGTWQTSLGVEVAAGTRGTLLAYALSPVDGSVVASAQVNVIYGQAAAGPYVTIENLTPYGTLQNLAPLAVTGTGGALPQPDVVVQALDNLGNVLAESATTLNAASPGAPGTWSANLNVAVEPGTRGSVIAFVRSPEDGSLVAFFRVPVTFGEPALAAQFAHLSSPLPATRFPVSGSMSVTGYAGGLPTAETVLFVQLLAQDGRVLAAQVVTPDPDTGFWQVGFGLANASPNSGGQVTVFFTEPDGATVIASDSVPVTFTE